VCGHELEPDIVKAAGYCSSRCALRAAVTDYAEQKPACICGKPSKADDTSIYCSFTCAYKGSASIIANIVKPHSSYIRLQQLWKQVGVDPTATEIANGLAETLKTPLEGIVGAESSTGDLYMHVQTYKAN
jgi:hypothetical protein